MADDFKRPTLILWDLLSRGGGAWLDALQPDASGNKGSAVLLERGFIDRAWRARPAPNGRNSRAYWVEATEKGWRWASENLEAPLPTNAPSAGATLQAWLKKLKPLFAKHSIALADVLRDPRTEPPDTKSPKRKKAAASSKSRTKKAEGSNVPELELRTLEPPTQDPEARIRHAYSQITGGKWGRRARLSELRPLLEDLSRDALDEALRDLQRAKRLVLYPLDDPREIAPADEAAAIRMGGQPVHVVYIAS